MKHPTEQDVFLLLLFRTILTKFLLRMRPENLISLLGKIKMIPVIFVLIRQGYGSVGKLFGTFSKDAVLESHCH
jgi:hypothetical protein